MELPKICGRRCFSMMLEKGETMHWCSCGRSKEQPFCDGSHRGTGLKPVEYTAEASEKHFFCLCKRTKKPPFCDGTHKSIPAEELDAALGKAE